MNEPLYAMVRAMETHRVLFHLRIIYILLFILSAFSIAALWVSLEAYSGLKRLDKVKWRMFRYPSYRNITEDEMQRAKRNHVEPPDMFQDVTFAGLSSSGIDLYPMSIEQFCTRVVSDCDLQFHQGFPGPKGAKGEPGIDGKGIKGCRGEKGDEGLPGLPGKLGVKGSPGLPGIQGISGAKGNMGDPGPEGPIGEKGQKGDVGNQGSRGIPGPKGDSGMSGRRGFRGPKGEIGFPGLKGEKGFPGEAGFLGQKGEMGFPGHKGVPGDVGPRGPIGFKGAAGPKGERGMEGPKGDKGNEGPKGERGIKGFVGEKGDVGPKGEDGKPGPKGDRGEKGSQGVAWSPSSNETCLCSCSYLGTPPTTSPVMMIQEEDMTTDIVACTPTSTTTSTSTTTTTTTTTTTPIPTTPRPRKSYCLIKKIGIPFFKMKTGPAKGCWMRDQMVNSERIWIAEGVSGQFLKEYTSIENTQEITAYNLTQFYFQGTNHIVYNGTFCYHWKGTMKIVCYDMRLQSVVMAKDVEDSNFDDDRTLYKGSNSYYDLEADDNGLWLIYSKKNDSDYTYVLQFYPGTLREYRQIKVPVNSRQYGNGFISCGILYLVKSASLQRTTIDFAYDLFEMKTIPISLDFINPFADSSMISFYYNRNPRLSRILGWDDGRQIDYQILFQ